MIRFFVWQFIMVSILLAAGPLKADSNIDAGRDKASTCNACHGLQGEGMGENPPIAGQDRQVLESGMLAYKTGERTEPMMAMFMQALSDEDIANLAAYFASLPSKE